MKTTAASKAPYEAWTRDNTLNLNFLRIVIQQLCAQKLTNEECNAIFASFSPIPKQVWHVGRRIKDSQAKCSGCRASQMVKDRLYMTVEGPEPEFCREDILFLCYFNYSVHLRNLT